MNLPLRAKVKDGHFVLEDPTTTELPEGTVVELYPAEDDDEMDDQERAALDASLAKSAEQIKRGETITHEELMKRLKNLP